MWVDRCNHERRQCVFREYCVWGLEWCVGECVWVWQATAFVGMSGDWGSAWLGENLRSR